LPPDLLHERIDGEYSFIETLRHLVFATDAWVRHAILGYPEPYSPLGLPRARRRVSARGVRDDRPGASRRLVQLDRRALNRPGMSGDSVPWKGWGHVSEYVEEVSGRAA
jgi:hypothetical protein